MRYFLGLLLFAFLCPQQAKAVFSAPIPQCDQGGTSSTFTTIACTATGSPGVCASTGNLLVVSGLMYGNGSTVNYAITDSVDGATGWVTTLNHVGTTFYTAYLFSKIATTNTCLTFTLTTSPGATAILPELHVFAFTGNAATAVADCTNSTLFTSNADTTFSSGNCTTTFTDDLMVGTVGCNSVFSTLEFSTNIAWLQLYQTDATPALANRGQYKLLTSAQTIASTWPASNQSCSFAAGVYGYTTVAGFKAADGAPQAPTQLWIILPDAKHRHKIPWDSRKRKLQIVSI